MEVTIIYDKKFGDFTHNGKLVFDLEKFVAFNLKAGNTIKFETRIQHAKI
jgi:hypothetical protein